MRWIVLLLTLAGAVLALVGTISLNVFSIDAKGKYGVNAKSTVNFFNIKAKDLSYTFSNGTTRSVNAIPDSRFIYSTCKDLKNTFMAIEGFALSGIVLGFFTFLASAVQCLCRLKMKLILFIFACLSAFCELLTVILCAVAHSKTFCGKSTEMGNSSSINFKKSGYKLDIQFILHIVSLVVFVICLILIPFTQQLWCGSK
ncbi:hypothetical protein AGDE_01432 [Angomonas deanei]|nr:hypothetical protein AGDE_01432 [Angomonas deanei]|eukprot:EPY42491.1 hypothetical protein AGDE_01432 [Angomonas deanei]